jgi:hypothetical protein
LGQGTPGAGTGFRGAVLGNGSRDSTPIRGSHPPAASSGPDHRSQRQRARPAGRRSVV